MPRVPDYTIRDSGLNRIPTGENCGASSNDKGKADGGGNGSCSLGPNPLNSKYLDWTKEIYTDGAFRSYEIEKCYQNGHMIYRWGDTVYETWDDLAKDMQEATISYMPQSDTFMPGGYYNPINTEFGYSWDGKFNSNGEPIGRSISVKLGGVGSGKHIGLGINIKYKF